jgi:outer membrane protein OmpA-like peptidoglycan-associated protein
MKSIHINLILFSMILFSISGCIKPGVELKQLNCPVTEQNCYPQPWKGIPVDTSSNNINGRDWHYKIEIVNGINSNSNEWQISKAGDKFVLTYSDGDIQKCLYILSVNVNQFSPLKSIELQIDKHYGSLNSFKDNIVFAMSNVAGKDTKSVKISESIGNSRIFTGEFDGERIVNVKNILKDYISNDLDWYAQPAVFPNKDIIFFASDREGGFGGTDIWYTQKNEDGNWSSPINASSKINTNCDELTPFISEKGDKLYFASSGRNTVGGYDLFVSEINNDFINNFRDSSMAETFFNSAENLKYPVNTEKDELFPYIPDKVDALYYSSNQINESNDKNKSGGFDIYVFHKVIIKKAKDLTQDKYPKEKLIEKKKIEKKEIEIIVEKTEDKTSNQIIVPQKLTLRGKVLEMNTLIPVDSAKIDLVTLPGNKKDTSIYSDKKGNYNLDIMTNTDYQLTAQKDRFYFDSKRVYIQAEDKAEDKVEEIDFFLPEQGNIRINFPLDEYKNPYQFTLDSNGIETGRSWQDEIEMIAENILISKDRIDKVILVGHTDDIADEDYNYKLGQKRVNFVIDELVKHGIPKNILISRSAGKLEPLPKHNNEDIDIYRKRLRRVTLDKILK